MGLKDLNTKQKIMIIVGDVVGGLGLFFGGSAYVHPKGTAGQIFLGALGLIFGLAIALSGLYGEGPRPDGFYMGISITYAAIGALVLGIAGADEKNKGIALVGLLAILVSLISVNVSAWKPNDAQAFNVLNTCYAGLGLLVIGWGALRAIEEGRKENSRGCEGSQAFVLAGMMMVTLSVITSNIIFYRK